MLLLSCAGQAPPSGGPLDTEPPKIISVYPAPSSLFYSDSKIVLEFDEYVDHSSVEGSIFVSPSLGPLEFDWSGTEVEVSFSDSLRSNTTYVFNVGTDVVDTRNKNRMAEAFSLAFSTGGTIDPGTIVGKVYPASFSDELSGVTVFAYMLDIIDPDTLDPSTLGPDYVTQTGKSGEFLLPHLTLGSYRLFAIRDEYRNLLYDPETDEFAAAGERVRLTEDDTLKAGVTMRLAREDTTAPRLIKVTPLNRGQLLAEVSEPLDTSSLGIENVRVTDTLGNRALKILSVAALLPQRTSLYLVTEEQDSGLYYELHLRNVRDLSGRFISSSAASIQFAGSDLPDTSRPAVGAFSISDSAKGVAIHPLLEIRFTEPVRRSAWEAMIDLRDSLDRSVPAEGAWINDAAMSLRPLNELAGSAWYRVLVRTGLLQDFMGMTGKDTTRFLHFQTLDSERLSSIEGMVSDVNKDDAVGTVIVTARIVGQKNPITKSTTVEQPGPFQLSQLPEGLYVMEAFRDRNDNGKFDAGRVFPFVMSERFSIAGDTLKLRARWPLENVRIDLK